MKIPFRGNLQEYEDGAMKTQTDTADGEYEKIEEDLNAVLHRVQEEIRVLNEKIRGTKNEIAALRDREAEIQNVLYTAHMEATEKILQVMDTVARIEQNKRNQIQMGENRHRQLKKTLKKVMDEIQLIMQ